MSQVVRVAQLSDTHFLEHGAEPEGGHAYDTDAAFDAVVDHLGEHSHLDMVVVTGDVADHGRAGQYQKAAEAFSRFQVPVNVCPGNHDFHAPFNVGIGRPGVSTSRAMEVQNWAFLFVDSSAGLMNVDESGLHVDPPGEERLHNNGSLGSREASWIRQMCEETSAEHVFVWLHHPPAPTVPLCHDDNYSAEWSALLSDVSIIRGLAGGHTHVPDEHVVVDRPVFVAPSLKNNFSIDPQTWLPPGYRTYEFMPDGAVTSDLHLVDDDRWPRRPFGRALKSLFMGEISFEELAEIVDRRASS